MTLLEIYKWQNRFGISNQELGIREFKISDIQKALDSSENLKEIIKCKNGFYYLKVDEELVDLRKKRHNLAKDRWKKLRRIASILQVVPNVKMFAACNTLVLNDIRPDSDIDVFVIIKDGRMWQTRFFITALVALLGQWRHKDNIANKICLSFYVTDKKMNLEKLSKKPYDPMLTYWVTFVYPLIDREIEISEKNSSFVISNEAERNEKSLEHSRSDLLREYSGQVSTPLRSARDDKEGKVSTYNKFIEENNWVKEYLPNFIKYNPNILERRVDNIYIFDILRKSLEAILNTKMGDYFEKIFKKIQESKMKKGDSWKRDDTDVIISDQMLKFHEKDRRDYFRKVYEENLENIEKI